MGEKINGAVHARISELGSYMKEIAQEGTEAREFISLTALHHEAHIRMQRTNHPERITVQSLEPNRPQSIDARVDRLTTTLSEMADRPRLGKSVPSIVGHLEVFVRATHEAKFAKKK